MATDDKNNDEQDDFFGDDDDFGLPELDYDALDDDTDDDASDEDVDDDSFDAIDGSDSDDDISSDTEDDLEDDGFETFGDDDDDFETITDSSDSDISEDDIPDDFDDLDMDDVMDETDLSDDDFQDESFEDFDTSDDINVDDDTDSDFGDDENGDSVFDSDSLGEDDFAQFEQDLTESEDSQMSDIPSFEGGSDAGGGEGKGNFLKVVVIGVIIFVALGSIFYLMAPFGGDSGESEVAEKAPVKKEQPVQKSEPVETETTAAESKETQQPAAKPVAKKPAPKPAPKKQVASSPGQINEVSARTGNYYVIIGSFLDRDLAMDYAKELSAAGKSPTIIPPFGKAITHRLAITGYGSLADAQNAVGSLKGEYGADIWVLKY